MIVLQDQIKQEVEENWAQMGESDEEVEDDGDDEPELPGYHVPPGSITHGQPTKPRKIGNKRPARSKVLEKRRDDDEDEDMGEVEEILAQRGDKFCVTYK